MSCLVRSTYWQFRLGFFQLHAALAVSRFVGDGVAIARSSTIAIVDARSCHVHTFDRSSADTFGRIFRIQSATRTALIALTKNCFAALNLEDMPPLEGFAARTVASFCAQRVAFAIGTAVT